jgi:hypothetical protein
VLAKLSFPMLAGIAAWQQVQAAGQWAAVTPMQADQPMAIHFPHATETPAWGDCAADATAAKAQAEASVTSGTKLN